MSKIKLLVLPFLVSFGVSCIAFVIVLFLGGVAVAGPLQGLEPLTRMLVLMVCTNGAAGLFGVMSGAAVATRQKRWVALVLAVTYAIAQAAWGAWMAVSNTQPADTPLDLLSAAAFVVGAALAVMLARQRYTE